MAMTKVDGGVLVTGDDIDLFKLLAFKGRLQLEIKGLGFSKPTLRMYNDTYGTKFSRKAAALKDCIARIEEFEEKH